MDTTTQLLLLNAARRSHIQQVILPNIAKGAIVLCDRFLASSLVFQSLNSDGTRNLDDAVILQSHAMFCFDLILHLRIELDAPTNVRLARTTVLAGADLDRFEAFGSAFDEAPSEQFRDCGTIIHENRTQVS